VKPFRDAFLPIGLIDAGAFHQILANTLLYLRRVRPLPEAEKYEVQEAQFHQTKALSIVSRKISDPKESTSDGVIATILGLACCSVRRQWSPYE
jgi:hypothetical protein